MKYKINLEEYNINFRNFHIIISEINYLTSLFDGYD
jgi:hypothetical protein